MDTGEVIALTFLDLSSAFDSIDHATLTKRLSDRYVLSGQAQIYADDTQIYMPLSVSNAKESIEKLQHFVIAVSAWITGSKLKLNPSKTEFLFIGFRLPRETNLK